MEKFSFCIPCYRSQNTISIVINEIQSMFSKSNVKYDYEIICAVDGSPDNVFQVLSELAKYNKKIKVINFSKNFGQASAQIATFSYVEGDYIVCLDDDGQCPLDKLWDLFEPIKNGKDVSFAKYPSKTQSAFKNFGSKINKLMMKSMLDVPKNFESSNFFIMKRFIVDEIKKYSNPYPYLEGLLSQNTKNYGFVEIDERERISGSTGYTFSKLISLWFNGLTNFSIKPLRISSLIGIFCAIIGFCFGIFTIVRKLLYFNSIDVGWSSIVSIILFIGGLIMLMLGMIGEYIGRIYISINNTPQYVVKETINIDEDE